MPDRIGDPPTTAVVRPLPSSETLRETVRRLADDTRLWTGQSGLTLTGTEIAQHLTAAREWLERNGWGANVRTQRALFATSPGGVDDMDTRTAATALLELILQARLNSPCRPDVEAWEARANRTWPEVAELLTTAAQLAREHGPQGGGS